MGGGNDGFLQYAYCCISVVCDGQSKSQLASRGYCCQHYVHGSEWL